MHCGAIRIPKVAKLFSANMLGLLLGIGITILLGQRLGATAQADAFVLARRLITGLGELLHRGMMLAFIPLLVAGMPGQGTSPRGPARAWRLRLLCAGGGVTAGLWLMAPSIVSALGAGMPADTQALATMAARLMLLAIPAMVLANLCTAELYLRDTFGMPALLKQLPRLAVFLAFALAASVHLVETAAAAFALGGYLSLAGCLHVVWRRRKAPRQPAPAPRPAIASAGFGVALLMVAGPQLVSWMEIYFASHVGAGALTLLEMSQRIALVVASVFIVSAVMPRLAEWSADNLVRSSASFLRALLPGLLLLVSAQGFFMVNAREVVELLYSGTRLTPEDLAQMASLIGVFAAAPMMVYLYQLVAIWNISGARRGLFRAILVATAANLAIRAAIAMSLVPVLGLHALALGGILGPAMAVLLLIVLGDRACWPEIMPRRELTRMGLAALATLAGLAAGNRLGHALAPSDLAMATAVLSMLASALLGAGTLALVAWRLRLVQYLRSLRKPEVAS